MTGRLTCVWLLITGTGLIASDGPNATTIHGKVSCPEIRNCEGALVYIERIPSRTFAPDANAVMDQLDLTFVPHVLPVIVGTKVAFPNSDEIRHNVFSASPTKRFNLGTYPRGVTKELVFDKPGVASLLCAIHLEMSAYIVAIETPYVARVQSDGTYELKNVPSGSYVVCAWHARLKEQRQRVTVQEGESVALDFELRQ